ncbi:nickel ABC transporter permease [Clostridium formicaceticum]|uniref:Nickel import system permease protein NikB n=1 Tax=Clostridium formicaceticum TaxID=1497 RepID=A0AAC9RRD3_9CLOT|nr:nickel ABC transporter permease [Clostridium formicaceticum]AOY74488.1 nickel ABC transporter permease subunit NikB [Clostridium formicaceticum]ARE88835.1 Nickel transport system permease protein NikB [Clostridium formicaceticum]
MKSYILKRISYMFLVLIGVSILTFLMTYITPGDPAELVLISRGIEPEKRIIEETRKDLGLDLSFIMQYKDWVKQVSRGDLGISYRTGRPVLEELLNKLPATIELTIAGFLVMLFISIPVGIISCFYKNTVFDHIIRLFSLLGSSIPSFWLGIVLIYFFSVRFSMFPVRGRGGLIHLILPSITLGLGMSAQYARLLRASMLEVLGQDFVLAARARGLKESMIIIFTVFKNSLLPVITSLGISLGHLLGGTTIVETIFSWPGLGKLIVESIFSRDYPMIQGYALFMAVVFSGINLLIDLTYKFIDPRINIEGSDD